MKTIKNLTLLLGLCAAVLLVAGCDKNNSTTPPDDLPPVTQKKELAGTWKCVLKHLDVAITLTIDPATDLVSVGKSPTEMSANDAYHQFRDGDLYFLQNDTLYLKKSDCNDCVHPSYAFEITRLSDDKMELDFLGPLIAYAFGTSNYLFNRIME